MVNNPTIKSMSAASFNKFKTDMLAKHPAKTPNKAERPYDEQSSATPSTGGGGGGASLSASLFGRYGMAAPPSTPATPLESKKRLHSVAAGAAAAAASIKAESMFASSPSAGGTPSAAADNYLKRRGVGDVKVHFNSALADVVVVGASASVKKVVSVQVVDSAKPYKYMWDTLDNRAAVFKDTTARLGNLLLNKHEAALDGLEPGPFHLPLSEEVLCFGKIVADGSDGKLETRGVMIEGQAPENDNIYRVKLDLKACPSYSLFPGQTVAIRGVNPTGSTLMVKKLLSDASLPVAATEESSVYEQATVKVTVAAGPFCSHENLDYRPLSDLMDVVTGNGTDVLVLMGPFVEAKHPEIEKGAIGRTYDDLFCDVLQHHVLRRVDAHNSTVARGKLIQKVVLMSSLQDMHHHPVFPQFAFASDAFVAYRDFLVMVGNPSQLRINGVLFGFTSVDPLKHMGSVALLQRPPAQPDQPPPLNRILEMASLLIEQQSFLPLNPPPLDVSLDCTSALSGVDFGEATPQVLLLPSALKEFVDPLKGVLVVNPSLLVRGGSGGGTFAEITMYPKGDDDLGHQPMDTGPDDATSASSGYNLMRRVGVKIVKI